MLPTKTTDYCDESELAVVKYVPWRVLTLNMPGDIRQTYSYLIHFFPFYFEIYGFLFLMDGLFCLLLPSNEG